MQVPRDAGALLLGQQGGLGLQADVLRAGGLEGGRKGVEGVREGGHFRRAGDGDADILGAVAKAGEAAGERGERAKRAAGDEGGEGDGGGEKQREEADFLTQFAPAFEAFIGGVGRQGKEAGLGWQNERRQRGGDGGLEPARWDAGGGGVGGGHGLADGVRELGADVAVTVEAGDDARGDGLVRGGRWRRRWTGPRRVPCGRRGPLARRQGRRRPAKLSSRASTMAATRRARRDIRGFYRRVGNFGP